MKATLFMATYNKNNELPNTLYSIARQKISFPLEVCIVDDNSDIDPEPIIRKFIPSAKYKRLDKQVSPDVIHSYALDLASKDSDILIRQSSDVIHGSTNTIERLCKGVAKKKICMATVANTDPPLNMHKKFDKVLPTILKQHRKGKRRSKAGGTTQTSFYFFLGAIRRTEYESLDCTKGPHCDVMLAEELMLKKYIANYPKKLFGFHQPHPKSLIPCSRIDTCDLFCYTKKRCLEKGWHTLDDYLKEKI